MGLRQRVSRGSFGQYFRPRTRCQAARPLPGSLLIGLGSPRTGAFNFHANIAKMEKGLDAVGVDGVAGDPRSVELAAAAASNTMSMPGIDRS